MKHADGSYSLTDFHGGLVHDFNASGVLVSEVDRNGYTTTLAYSGGRLTSVTDASGRSLSFSYNTAGRISQVTDPIGRTVTYGYDSAGNLTDATDPAGEHWQFGYDVNHRMTSMTDPNGGVTSNVYDAQNRVTTQTDPMNRATTFAYSGDPSTATGSTTTITDPRGLVTVETYQLFALQAITTGSGTGQAATTTFSYDPFTLGVASRTDPDGHTTTYSYDRAGNQLRKIDALNRKTSMTWTALNLPNTITDPNGTTTTYSYDSNGNLTQVARPLTGTASMQTTKFSYGDASHPGDITTVTDPDGHSSQLAYDTNGDLSSVADAVGDRTSYGYDGIGRRTTMVTARGNAPGANPADYTWTYSYDAMGRVKTVTDPLGHMQVSNSYDGDGNITVATDADGNVTHHHFDMDNELTSVTRADSSTLGYGYDADGDQTSYTDGAGHTTSYTFADPAHPGSVTATTDADNRTITYSYDRAGNLISKQDPGGNCAASPASGCTSYSYDQANELVGIAYSDGSTPDVTYTYTPDGQRASMADGTGNSSYHYDSLNRLTSTTNGAGNSVGYGYDLAGNTTSVIYPNGHTVTRGYDAANRLTSIADWLGHTTAITPDQDGNTSTTRYGNGVTANQSFNHADQLAAITDTASGSTLASFSYTRDANGQLTTLTPTGVTQPNESYSYDQLNRLTGVNSSSYGYDAGDNLTQLPDGNRQSFDPADQLLASSPAPISLVGTARGGGSATDTSATVTLPAGTGAADQILIAITVPEQETPSTPSGYTLVGSYTSGSTSGQAKEVIYRRTAAAGDTSVTLTVPYGLYSWTFVLAVYHGVDPSNPIDTSSYGSTSGGNSVTAPAITTSAPGDELVVLDAENHSNSLLAQIWTPPSGMTQQAADSVPTSATALADATQTPAGSSGSKTSTLSGASANLVSVLLALQPIHTAYSYNPRGDRTSRVTANGTTTSYSYDQANRLTTVSAGSTVASYAYNGDGLRVSHTDNGTTTQQTWGPMSGTRPLLLADGTTSYLYDDNGSPIEQIDGSGTPLYYQHDQYGSTRLLTDQSGTIVATYSYDAYGNLTDHTGTADTPLRWNGQYQDTSTGLYYLRARYYDPTTAQFLTRDPLVAETGSAYGYVDDNPLNATDPMGLCSINPFSSDNCVSAAANAVTNAVSTATQSVGDAATTAWNDTGGAVVHWTYEHPREAIGIGLGVLAAGTGVGALVEGATALGVGLGAASVVTGVGASALDAKPCFQSHGQDHAACAGFALGAGGALAGTGGLVGAGGVLAGLWGEESLANGLLTGVGAFGLNVGVAGTALDIGTAFGPPGCGSSS